MMFEIIIVTFIIIGLVSGVYLAYMLSKFEDRGMAIMIEIRIPKEIKNYREKLFFGLTLRQSICAGVALLICVPLYIFGNKFIPQEALSWLVILIAAPLMLAGFFRYNDMTFEQFAVEFIYHSFTPQKRVYSYEPIFI